MFRNTVWTLIGYGTSLSLRLMSNVVLARLLAPELLGIMLIVSSVRYGVELLTDFGIEQNIVKNNNGLDPQFFNTAWTLQIIRGLCLTLLFLAFSIFIADFYVIERSIFVAIAFCPLINSLSSTSIFALVKNLQVKERNLFELKCEAFGFVVTVGLAFATRSIWALVIGTLLTVAFRALTSYGLPHPAHKVLVAKEHAYEILRFGGWIAISSLVMYAGTNIDRIYLGKALSLDVVGIYGLARVIADIPTALASRLSYQILFPMASARDTADRNAEALMNRMRFRLLAIATLGVGFGIATADIAVSLLYDARYVEAGWILSLLLLGSWFGVLSTIGEAFLLGANRPSYPGIAQGGRLAVLAITLPMATSSLGLIGAIWALVLADIIRCIAVMTLQKVSGYRFLLQDITLMCTLVTAISVVWAIRSYVGFPPPWQFLSFTAARW